jgi:hypothetical protein
MITDKRITMLIKTFNATLKSRADGNGVYKRFKLVETDNVIKFHLKLQRLAVDSPNVNEVRHNIFETEKQLVTYLDGIETGMSL